MFKFEFTEQNVNVILKALGDQPFRDVAGVITDIQKQAQATSPDKPNKKGK